MYELRSETIQETIQLIKKQRKKFPADLMILKTSLQQRTWEAQKKARTIIKRLLVLEDFSKNQE